MTGGASVTAPSVLAAPKIWALAMACTFARDPTAPPALTCEGMATTGSPAEEPGISIQMILASCQAIAMTSIRVTQRGNN